MSQLIIVSGPPCSGKTTTSKYFADKLHIPLISKDNLKERLFDFLGWKNKEWSDVLSSISMTILYDTLEEHLKRNQPLMIESNFKVAPDKAILEKLLQPYPLLTTEIFFTASPEILMERFIKRTESGERHIGHGDRDRYQEAKKKFNNPHLYRPLAVGQVIEVDTSNFDVVDYDQILEKIIMSKNG